MRIVRPLMPAGVPVIGHAAGTGAANLLTPSPKEAFVAAAVGVTDIIVDLGTPQAIDSIFLGATNASAGAVWSIAQMSDAMGGGAVPLLTAEPFRHPESIGPVHHGLAALAAPATTRFLKISVTQSGAAPFFAGTLVIGKAFAAPHELGAGRIAIDTGTREPLQDGGFGIGEGVVKAGVRWTFAGLSPAQVNTLWAIVAERGERRPVLVIEGDGSEPAPRRNEELHYGLFDSFEAFEREAPGETRWSLAMTEWV